MINADPKNARVVKPYVNGDDLNGLPPGTILRWIVDFRTISEDIASTFKLPFSHVKEQVQPFRFAQDPTQYQTMIDFWWQHWRPRKELYDAIKDQKRIIVMALTSKYICSTFISVGFVYDQTLICIPSESSFILCVLQSWIHAVWAIQFGATIGETFRYNPTRCYQTFPFPEKSQYLEYLGQQYWLDRELSMKNREVGLTGIYNILHNQSEKSEDVAQIRNLQMEMDNAVAAAYGWTDLDLGHGFHETKQGIRFTISEEARRIVLDRLLELNHQRYEEEVKAGLHDKKSQGRKNKEPEESGSANDSQLNIFHQ